MEKNLILCKLPCRLNLFFFFPLLQSDKTQEAGKWFGDFSEINKAKLSWERRAELWPGNETLQGQSTAGSQYKLQDEKNCQQRVRRDQGICQTL